MEGWVANCGTGTTGVVRELDVPSIHFATIFFKKVGSFRNRWE